MVRTIGTAPPARGWVNRPGEISGRHMQRHSDERIRPWSTARRRVSRTAHTDVAVMTIRLGAARTVAKDHLTCRDGNPHVRHLAGVAREQRRKMFTSPHRGTRRCELSHAQPVLVCSFMSVTPAIHAGFRRHHRQKAAGSPPARRPPPVRRTAPVAPPRRPPARCKRQADGRIGDLDAARQPRGAPPRPCSPARSPSRPRPRLWLRPRRPVRQRLLKYSHPATRPRAEGMRLDRLGVAVSSCRLTHWSRRRPRWPPCCC